MRFLILAVLLWIFFELCKIGDYIVKVGTALGVTP